jgi:sporulation protein YlmC with PRC-barrel domain
MPSPLEVADWHEREIVSEDGEHVGKLVDVYVARDTGEPEFLLVSSGFLGHRLHLVPAEGATTADDERIRVTASKADIESAPSVPADDDLSADEERRVFEHYGRDYTPHPEGILVMRRFVLIERG